MVATVKERITTMGGKKDQIKGRIKEAAGVLTDNDRLKREGKLDQAVGSVKETAEKAVDKIKNALTGNRRRGAAT
jgi:uncharacterized protein YjbJ (UPF0337 family)